MWPEAVLSRLGKTNIEKLVFRTFYNFNKNEKNDKLLKEKAR